MAVPLSAAAKQFYEALWAPVSSGFIELTLIRKNTKDVAKKDEVIQWFFPFPEKLDEFLAKAAEVFGSWNVYHGCGIRSRMRGKDEDVGAITAFTCDIDFKKTPEAEARKLVHEFPIRPSAVLRTGGGIHVYWFLKEAVTGDDLKKVKPILHAIAAALKGDHAACSLKQILRFPESPNIKYDHKPAVKISYLKPDPPRYSPIDFDILPQEAPKERAPGKTSAQREAPAAGLLPESEEKISKLLGDLWTKGWRHRMALDVAGMLAHAGVSEQSAKSVVGGVSDAAGGQTESRLKDVEDTYRNFMDGKEIAGASSIEKMIVEEFPEVARNGARKTLNEIRKLLPRRPVGRPKNEVEPDFEIKKIVKFDSRPARFHLTISHKGEDHDVTCETAVFGKFQDLRLAFMEATKNHWLANVGQVKWEEMTGEALLEVKQAPAEATPGGAVETALERFLTESKERPKLGELKSFPGYDEESSYFQLPTFKAFLRDQGIRPTEQLVCNQLRNLGWQGSIVRRFGDKTARVWFKPVPVNGHATHDLFKPAEPPKAPEGLP